MTKLQKQLSEFQEDLYEIEHRLFHIESDIKSILDLRQKIVEAFVSKDGYRAYRVFLPSGEVVCVHNVTHIDFQEVGKVRFFDGLKLVGCFSDDTPFVEINR